MFSTVLQYGIPGVLIVILILIIQDPDRALKLKALLLEPTFRLFKWGSRQYIASQTGYVVTQFFKKHVNKFIPSLGDIRVVIKWVTSPSDPILSRDGTLIVCLKETNNQTLNILTAARVAMPHVVCSTLRPSIDYCLESAIDLTLLKKLTDRLGKHAHSIFQRQFLIPETEEGGRVSELFKKLVLLDDFGIFVTIFLEELNVVGEYRYSVGEISNITIEVESFLEFLLGLADREVHELVPLEHFSPNFNIGVMLLSITTKAEMEGVVPYIDRLDKKVKMGCDSIYVVAYPHAAEFLNRIIQVVENDDRVSVNAIINVSSSYVQTDNKKGAVKIAQLHRNSIFSDVNFEEKIIATGIEEGNLHEGTVMDLTDNIGIVSVSGINGIIYNEKCSWRTTFSCKEILHKGHKGLFLIEKIDKSKSRLELSLKLPQGDPWKSSRLPKEGDIIEVEIVKKQGTNYICTSTDNIEVILPINELSWITESLQDSRKLINTKHRVKIYDLNENERKIYSSIRRLDENPWPEIHKHYPKGKELRGKVVEVGEQIVKVQIPNGMIGYILGSELVQAGYEYSDYKNTMVKGQGIDVVIQKIFIDRQSIRLGLRRNID